MADIELVIRIPEGLKKDFELEQWTALTCAEMKDALEKAILLPKDHGRLIDADVFEKRLMDARSYYLGEKADDFDLRFAAGLKSAAERLVDAQTIIEADKAESEDKE